ncbi:MAG: TIGR00730 family Rossman fold protein [Anaerolineae bacterium]|nr:TIGR00730 family Rossman fold protein [Anaerolineae bacterium]
MNRVCVFCGSYIGNQPAYAEAARLLGLGLARRNWTLVYGGAKAGLMGIVADATITAGGSAIGVIPYALGDKELAHQGLTELRFVNTMHERKAMMEELSDAFIVLPGGFGTMDEFFEIVTWAQLGIHQKAIGLLSIQDYYRPLMQFIDHVVAEGFVKPHQREIILSSGDPEALLTMMETYTPPLLNKWVKRAER